MYFQIDDLISDIERKNDIVEIFKYNVLFTNNKEDLDMIIDYMILQFSNKLKNNINQDIEKYVNSINHLNIVRQAFSINANLDMTIDNLLISLWEEFKQ